MKTPIVLAVGCLLASASCSHAQQVAPTVAAAADAAVPTTMTAAQILEKSRQTYAAFSSYKGSCSVVGDAMIAIDDGDPMQSATIANAEIEFDRDKYLSVEGIDMGGQPYRALWTPAQTWLEIARERNEKGDVGVVKREIIGDKPNFPARRALFASLTGVTANTGSIVPTALMPDQFDMGNPFSSLGTARLLPARNLGNVACFVIEQTVPELNSLTTYWIEQKTFLLRRMTREQGEQSYDDMPLIDGKALPILRIAYSLNQFVFVTTEAK